MEQQPLAVVAYLVARMTISGRIPGSCIRVAVGACLGSSLVSTGRKTTRSSSPEPGVAPALASAAQAVGQGASQAPVRLVSSNTRATAATAMVKVEARLRAAQVASEGGVVPLTLGLENAEANSREAMALGPWRAAAAPVGLAVVVPPATTAEAAVAPATSGCKNAPQ